MRKFIAIALAFCCVLSLCACGKKDALATAQEMNANAAFI